MTITTSVHIAGGQAPAILKAAEFLVRWAECLQGSGDLRNTLALFAALTGSRIVNLSRIDPETGRQRSITCLDLDAREGKRPLTKGMAPSILSGHGVHARSGTIWTLSEKDFAQRAELDNRNQRWMEDRGFGEVVVILLGRNGTDLDVIEFYCTKPLADVDDPTLQWLASSAADVWGRRRKGRLARLLRSVPAMTGRLQDPDPSLPVNVLSPDNPCSLTAAETRICILMQDGYRLNEIDSKIGVAESTVRSHLRSIYAKTGAAGQIGLVRMLLNSEEQGADLPCSSTNRVRIRFSSPICSR